MGKIKTVVIFAAGYVVGARAGRQRYQQIKNWVQTMWGKPIVQEQIDKVGEQVGKLAHEAKEHLPGFSSDGQERESRNSTDSAKDPDAKKSAHASDETVNSTDALHSGKDPYVKNFGHTSDETADGTDSTDSDKDPYAKNFGRTSDETPDTETTNT